VGFQKTRKSVLLSGAADKPLHGGTKKWTHNERKQETKAARPASTNIQVHKNLKKGEAVK